MGTKRSIYRIRRLAGMLFFLNSYCVNLPSWNSINVIVSGYKARTKRFLYLVNRYNDAKFTLVKNKHLNGIMRKNY